MEEEKEDRQDRSTQHHHHHHYATTTSSEASGSGREEVATTAAAVPGGEEEEEEEGGIQSHWLTSSNDDTNDIHALKNATSHEYGGVSGGNSIIGSSSYLNFSRSLSWEIPTNGTLSNIGKSTSFSTPHHPHSQQQNDQQQHIMLA